MRKVGAYLLERRLETSLAAARRAELERILAVIVKWMNTKGLAEDKMAEAGSFTLRDGRTMVYESERVELDDAGWHILKLEQPIDGGASFRTVVSVTDAGQTVVVYCTLEVGLAVELSRISPVPFDPYCPKFIRDLLSLSGDWFHGSSKLFPRVQSLSGEESGNWLVQEILDVKRHVPLVVISEDEGFVLHDELETRLAFDLAGLANVYRIDADASWVITEELGREWSCYSGAVRLYWPNVDLERDPFEHPLWTSGRLLSRERTAPEAVQLLRDDLRRRLMAASALSVKRPPAIDDVRRRGRQRDLAKQLQVSSTSDEYRQLAEGYATENDRLVSENIALRDELEDLRVQLVNEKAMRAWQSQPALILQPEEKPPEPPPATVAEAVERATRTHSADLLFGNDVDRGVGQLRPEAGPPDKILRYLRILAEAAIPCRANTLGTTIIAWLNGKGVNASRESETVRNSAADQKRRTWHDGSGPRYFDSHLKPKEATDPANCVRIYFDWDDKQSRMIVGWVGRHP